MVLPVVDVNLIAVAVAGVVTFIFGMVYFAPFSPFGKMWLQASGMTPEQAKAEMKKKGPTTMGAAALASIVMAYVLANILAFAQAGMLMDALAVGFLVWLGFLATTHLGMVLWNNKPVKLYLAIVLHDLIAVSIMASILTLWV